MKEWDQDFIEKIIKSIDMEEFIGEYVQLKRRGRNLFGSCPFHDEKTASFCVTPSKDFWNCFGCGVHGNIINFVQKYFKMSYDSAVEYLAGELGLIAEKSEVSPSVQLFKKIKRRNTAIKERARSHKLLDKCVLNDYEYGDIPLWRKDGIPQEIMDRYGVGFDRRSQRIVYPVYDTEGNLINIKGRTVIEDYKNHKPPIPKYINYEQIGDMDYLQGMNFKKEYIEKCGECILFESFKSVMLADSYGVLNSVSVESHNLNKFQMRILLSLKCDVVVAFDADIPIVEIRNSETINRLKFFTNVYVVYDEDHLLGASGNKSAPVDKGKEIWNKLYENKIRI